ncbi:MAG: baseplate J/gp47 family protein [Proteobacteria bacterium]|nr:baseplate J/gp47 family protein [Pseudomonadota bacterium]
MTKREPNLELLLRGDVLALSELDYASQRQDMLEALHDVLPRRYGQRDSADPGIALIQAVAAALDVLGLYHDRFATESKLGSAVLIQSVARLAEAVGYVPLPRLAARALQFFEANAEAILASGTKVAGRRDDPPGNVFFETVRALSIGPAFNLMPMSPLISLHANASRAVIELVVKPTIETLAALIDIDPKFAKEPPGGVPLDQLKTVFDDLNVLVETGRPTPQDDFQDNFLAMVNGLFGLELAAIKESRGGAIALQRGLRASYSPATTFIHAATQVRHLRMWRPLGTSDDGVLPDPADGPELVVFELAETPILHYPDENVAGGLRSSLEVFVFEGVDDPGLPSTWSGEDAWTEVRDFSASEASDRHYRTFVDDRLHTYLILRRRLGYRVLLSDQALCRVFVRYTPAIGSSSDVPLFQLDREYFESNLVCPTVETSVEEQLKLRCDPVGDRYLKWAITDEPLGLDKSDQILIKNGESDRIYIRTLNKVRGRYIDWAGSAASEDEDRPGPAYGHGLWDLNHWFGGNRPEVRSELGSPVPLHGVWGNSDGQADHVFVVGRSGTVLHFDGTSWQAMPTGTSQRLRGIWGSKLDQIGIDVFAVGESGTVLRFDGDAWQSMQSGTDQLLFGVWGSKVKVNVGDDVKVVLDVFAVGESGTVLRFDGDSWQSTNVGPNGLYGVWGSGPDNVFAVGESGTILHFDGTLWQAMQSGTGELLLGVWGSGPDNIFAVGQSGTILRFDGTSWQAMQSDTDQLLLGVWGSGPDNVFAVGKSGTVRYFDGTSWQLEKSGTDESLTGVWGSGPDHVIAASESGTILRFDGVDSWQPMDSSILRRLLGDFYVVSADFEVISGRRTLPTLGKEERTDIPEQFDSLEGCFTPKKTELMPLRDAADGQDYPLWEEFYNRVEVPEFEWSPPPPPDPDSPPTWDSDTIRSTIIVPKGSIFLFLRDTSLVKPGDFFLIGARIVPEFRPVNYDPIAPWIKAEVVQAQEVHGRVVRLRYPTAAEYRTYFEIDLDKPETLPKVAVRVLVVPLVASVFFGDRFTQTVALNLASDGGENCRKIAITGSRIRPRKLREEIYLNWATQDAADTFKKTLFLAVAGHSEKVHEDGQWSVHVLKPGAHWLQYHVEDFFNKDLDKVEIKSFNSIGGSSNIILEIDNLWGSVDSDGELELYAELHPGDVWQGDDELEATRDGSEHFLIELLKRAPSPHLRVAQQLTLEGIVERVEIQQANHANNSYRINDPGFDIEEVRFPGVRWTERVTNDNSPVTNANQFRLVVVDAGAKRAEFTVIDRELVQGRTLTIYKSDQALGSIIVVEPKGDHYIVNYTSDSLDEVTLVDWTEMRSWSLREDTLKVVPSDQPNQLLLQFIYSPPFGNGHPLTLLGTREALVEGFTDPQYRVAVPGLHPDFAVTRVTLQGLRWESRKGTDGEVQTDDDFFLDPNPVLPPDLDPDPTLFRLVVTNDNLGPGDQIAPYPAGQPRAAVVRRVSTGDYILQHGGDFPVAEDQPIMVPRVRIRHEFSIHLELPIKYADPPDPQPPERPKYQPWVLTFNESAPLKKGVLLHTGAKAFPDDEVIAVEFQPPQPDQPGQSKLLLERYRDAGLNSSNPAVHVHENKAAELCGDVYEIKDNTDNFISSEKQQIDFLWVTNESEIFLTNPSGTSIFIGDKAGVPGTESNLDSTTFVVIDESDQFSQSIIFNSGNFIPVFNVQSEASSANIEESLQLTVYGPDLGSGRTLKFSADLDFAEDTRADPNKYIYNVNKTPGGVFTINIRVKKSGPPPKTLEVQVEYAAPKAADASAKSAKLYEFETDVLPWNPLTQLVLVDSGDLETGDYLFLRTGAPDEGLPIQWTRVQSIHGRVVSVDPALFYQPKAARCYALQGLAKVPRPQTLDPEYYTLLSDAVLKEPPGNTYPKDLPLVLGDQLPLDPQHEQTLLESLVPGDHLLIWDERWRKAWRDYRQEECCPSSDIPVGGDQETWVAWPDYQYEAIIKSVDAAIGLIVLEEPLPERFRVVYVYKDEGTLCPRGIDSDDADDADYRKLKILPYYRAPFQGRRELVAIGSGDQGKKFPRFLTEIERELGLASVPLDVAGTFASNIEVLSQDPRSEEWTRWTEFQTLDTAASGDTAFTMGIELTSEQQVTLPLSVSFGDGITGQLLPTGEDNIYIRTTDVGRWHNHLQTRRELNIIGAQRKCEAPFKTPGTGAQSPNLCLLVEFGDHAHWHPTGGTWPWRPSMTVQLTRKHLDQGSGTWCCNHTVFREITCEQARCGHDGIYVSSYRPGVVQVFFFSPDRLIDLLDVMVLEVWAEPQSRVWNLNSDFYDAVANPERSPSADSSALIALLETRGLRAGSLLAFHRNGETNFELAEVKDVEHDTYSATLEAPLKTAYPVADTSLRGNLVYVEEGQSERQFIGSGDGKTVNMRLPLRLRRPVVYSQDPASSDPTPGVTILVDGVAWQRLDDLGDSGPRDRVYRLDRDPGGDLTVEFGDGQNGAVPPRGTDNIEAIIRFASEAPANVDAGVIDKLRDGNLAVANTWNLLAAAGGREAESPSEARDTLRKRGLPYSRAITAEDIARAALDVGGVTHARVDPTARGRTVRIAVALDRRRTPDQTILDEVRRRLLPQLPVTAGTTIDVVGAVQQPVHIVVTDITADTGFSQGDVLSELNKAFAADGDGFFALQHWSIGRALRLGDLYEAIFAVDGVATARVRWMSVEKPPLDLPVSAAETVEAGPTGVIQCDNDPSDSYQERGSLRFDLGGGPS